MDGEPPYTVLEVGASGSRSTTGGKRKRTGTDREEGEGRTAAKKRSAGRQECEANTAADSAAAMAARASTPPAEEEAAAVADAAAASTTTEEVPSVAAADAYVPNSPICMPHMVEYDSSGEELCHRSLCPDPVLLEAYEKADEEYSEKIAQLTKLPTLDNDTAIDPKVAQESASDTILKAAKFVLGLSAYIDGVLLRKCSGILMEWGEGIGTILTTANLLCSRSPNVDEWLGGKEYALNAEVNVQLLQMDDTEVNGKLIYLDKQYEFALISVPMDPPKELAHFSNEVKVAHDVFLLGRDRWALKIGDGKVMGRGAGECIRHHHMFTNGYISPCGAGGAVIDLEGRVIGMVTSSMDFIPSSIILKCLHLWRAFRCLNLVSKEKISRKFNVDAGLIIVEVAGGSNAEKLGVRMGDIIQSVNGECIATAIELENLLLDICKDHLGKGSGRDSDVDVMVVLGVFNTTKCVPGRIQLMAKLSHDVEIVARGEYRISAREL